MTDKFFEHQTISSKIKALIVSDYFPKYCKILLKYPQEKIRYIDLFAGPGIYEDGSISTPILVANACYADSILRSTVELAFNDNVYCSKLKDNFEQNYPIGSFANEPHFGDKTIGEDPFINDFLCRQHPDKNPHPSLLFIDPFGYKAIETNVLTKFLKNWGNEIFLFLNIKRIHAAIENNKFDELMLNIFPTTINEVRKNRKYTSSVEQRLSLIVESLKKEYEIVVPGVFFTAFKFQEEDSIATSHYIIHFTKHPRGYELVKQIYYDFDNIGSTLERDGTYTFDAKKMDAISTNTLQFDDENISALSEALKKHYTGRKISAESLFYEHQSETKYAKSHYTSTLRFMVEKSMITSTFIDSGNHSVSVLISKFCILQF